MGNINNTHIEYWTKSGLKISYLFWDLKGKNRFLDQPSDPEIAVMFSRCIGQIDISSYQLKAIQQFTPKYKYRFVVLHKRKVADALKQNQIKKLSLQYHQTQICEEAKTIDSIKKLAELQKLMAHVELNQSTIKIALNDVQRFIIEMHGQKEFIEIKGIERLLGLLETSKKMNENGSKNSFSSQVELLKFLRSFSVKYSRQFYGYISQIKSYVSNIISNYHPINTQLIAYSLSLLGDYAWKMQSEDEKSLVQSLQKWGQNGQQSFLYPLIQSIVESQSIVNLYYNIRFINQLLGSIIGEKDRNILRMNLERVKYSLLLQGVKSKLERREYCLQKSTFISIYQAIFKHSIKKQIGGQKASLEKLLQDGMSCFSFGNSRWSLQRLHEQSIVKMIQNQSYDPKNVVQNSYEEEQLLIYLSESDKKEFNKVIFDVLTEMQKYYKLEYYLYCQQDQLELPEYIQNKAIFDSQIISNTIDTSFAKIKAKAIQSKYFQTVNNCLNSLQHFQQKDWQNLLKYLHQGVTLHQQLQFKINSLQEKIQQKQQKIQKLLKQNNQLKTYPLNSLQTQISNQLKHNQHILKPPQSLEDSLKSLQSKKGQMSILLPPLPLTPLNISQFSPTLLPPPPPPPLLPPPPPPLLPLTSDSNLNSINQKEKRRPPKQLKACNYTIISYDKIKNSIFEEIDDTAIKLNENQILGLFAKSTSQSLSTSISSSRLVLTSSNQEVTPLFKPDRLKNIEIVLAKLKIPKGEFRRLLLQCDGGKLMSQTTLQAVQKILPTQDQQHLIDSFQGNLNDLPAPYQFIKQLISVPQYPSRIKSMIFSHIYQQLYHEIQRNISTLKKAFVSLRKNTMIKSIIQHVLAIGNYLNGQSFKGGAWGFKLQTIQRLQEVKSQDGKIDAAIYLVRMMQEKFQSPLFQKQEIQLYQQLAKIPLSQIKFQINELQGYVNSIQKALKSKDETNQKDRINQFCLGMQSKALEKLSSYKKMFKQLNSTFKDCASYYCDDSNTLATDQFGKKMYQFVLFISNTQKIKKILSEQKLQSSRYKTNQNMVSYDKIKNQSQEIKEFKDVSLKQQQQTFSKSTLNITNTLDDFYKLESLKGQEEKIKNDYFSNTQTKLMQYSISRQSYHLSSIVQSHKPFRSLEQLSQQQKHNQLKFIQRQSMNRAFDDVLKRRTQKLHQIALRFSKVSNPGQAQGKTQIERISFLKGIGTDVRITQYKQYSKEVQQRL